MNQIIWNQAFITTTITLLVMNEGVVGRKMKAEDESVGRRLQSHQGFAFIGVGSTMVCAILPSVRCRKDVSLVFACTNQTQINE